MEDYKKLEETINYKFQNTKLLQEALTHPSVKRLSRKTVSYQRLEFLGDKALGLIIGNYLFKHFVSENEGQISKRHAFLVCGSSVSQIARSINLGSFVILSINQENDGGRVSENILENTLEALIGAIFLDGGLVVAEKIVLNLFAPLFEKIEELTPPQDGKSAFQEWFQKIYKKIPEYKLCEKEDDLFVVELTFKGKSFFGKEKTIKSAEKSAATEALNWVKQS